MNSPPFKELNVPYSVHKSRDLQHKTNKQTLWPESASELYRPNLVPTFADRGVSRSQRGGSAMAIILVF
jgi:hypothetical protein